MYNFLDIFFLSQILNRVLIFFFFFQAILSGVFALSAAGLSYRVTASPSYGYQGPAAPLAHDGTVLDTPEVAQAKAAHLAAHAAAVARTTHGHHYDQGYYGYHNEQPPTAYERISYNAPHYQGYHGSQAPLAHDGRVVDTPEVSGISTS